MSILIQNFNPELMPEIQERDYIVHWRGFEWDSGIPSLLLAFYKEQIRRYQTNEGESDIDPFFIAFDTGEVFSMTPDELVDLIDKKCYNVFRFIRNWRLERMLRFPWKIEELVVNHAAKQISEDYGIEFDHRPGY